MTLTIDQINIAALNLKPSERTALAEELLLSVSTSERDAIDAAWLAEVQRRDGSPVVIGANARPMGGVLSMLERRLIG